ncbi:outer membrane beta-barrel protein [Orenia marismortui]|uniref:Outer membrane protein with beta-barrel domain n=1 Tax=Orenia marismortui TaxID=46469 RepID=A0A4R8GRZ3_9FIRM|nr:outer membrane beta-barrel protein [Orenia marismortui]TDX45301.1 outer membrane protein with beta-barrel domain [Orenia marismortui]
MKKTIIFTILATLILGMTINVSAANTNSDWEGYGGLSFYSFDEDEAGDDSSIGFFAGARKWNSEQLSFGGEWDYTSYDAFGYIDASLMGILGTVTYKISDTVSLNGGLGIYKFKVENGGFSNSENDLGMRIGAETNIPLDNDMELMGRIGYRIIEIEDADFGGLQLSAGLTKKF